MNKYNRNSQIQRRRGYQWEKGRGRSKARVGDKEIQITMHKISKLQGYIVQHREYNQYFIITLNGIPITNTIL